MILWPSPSKRRLCAGRVRDTDDLTQTQIITCANAPHHVKMSIAVPTSLFKHAPLTNTNTNNNISRDTPYNKRSSQRVF